MIQDLETLTTDDMMQILHLSRAGLYRRLRDARAGRGGLPLPIAGRAKQGLRWLAKTVREFLENVEAPQECIVPKMESEKKRRKRHSEAMKELEKLGITTARRKEPNHD